MIEVSHLTKKYGKLCANDDISLSVAAGETGILLGPNGAGKSTLIKCICGLLRFQGTVTIAGFDNHSVQAKRLLGYVPEFPALYPMLTVSEHLEFIARAYRLEGWEAYAEELLRRFELDDKANKLGKELSKNAEKVSVCRPAPPGRRHSRRAARRARPARHPRAQGHPRRAARAGLRAAHQHAHD